MGHTGPPNQAGDHWFGLPPAAVYFPRTIHCLLLHPLPYSPETGQLLHNPVLGIEVPKVYTQLDPGES